MEKKKKKKSRSKFANIIEFTGLYLIIFFIRVLPLGAAKALCNLLGDIFFFTVKKRRNIALENLRHAFGDEKADEELENIARESCRSFIFTPLEIIKLRHIYKTTDAINRLRKTTKDLDLLFDKAKKIHDDAKGCIFVTPHIGNWEVLPHASSVVGIPLAVVARPMDNPYLEKLIYSNRVATGQVIVPKKNAMFVLQRTLQKGNSIGMLPDQSTKKGIPIDFFGRKAYTTPVPAMLAITHNRPVVVVACCRKNKSFEFDAFVSDPIWPGEFTSEKEEIIRITDEITREMESIIRKYPEQYLWIHNRWKSYGTKSVLMS